MARCAAMNMFNNFNGERDNSFENIYDRATVLVKEYYDEDKDYGAYGETPYMYDDLEDDDFDKIEGQTSTLALAMLEAYIVEDKKITDKEEFNGDALCAICDGVKDDITKLILEDSTRDQKTVLKLFYTEKTKKTYADFLSKKSNYTI